MQACPMFEAEGQFINLQHCIFDRNLRVLHQRYGHGLKNHGKGPLYDKSHGHLHLSV